MKKLNLKIILIIVAILFIVVTIIFFFEKKSPQNEVQPQTPSYIYLSLYDKAGESFIYKVDVANEKITNKKQIIEKENFNALFLVKFNNYPDNIFMIGDTKVSIDSEFVPTEPRSYLFKIKKQDLSIEKEIPFSFSVAEVWSIPQRNQIVASGFNYYEEIKKGAGKFVDKITYIFQNDELQKIEIPQPTYNYQEMPSITSIPIDLFGIPLEYYVYRAKKMIVIYAPYWLGEIRILNLPSNLDKIYDFDRYLQPVVFPDEKKALLLAFKKDGTGRNVISLDLVENKIINDNIQISQESKVRILSLSSDNNQFYVYEDSKDKEDRVLIYDVNSFNLVKEIKIGNRDLGRERKTILSSDSKYLATIFEGYDDSIRTKKNPPGYLLILDIKNLEINLLEIPEGWPNDIIAD